MDQKDMDTMDGVSIEERPTDCVRWRKSSLPYASTRFVARETLIPRSVKSDDGDVTESAQRHSGLDKQAHSSLVSKLAEYRF